MLVRGKSALVTGASRGLGAALALELARSGVRVVLVGRSEATLARRVESIREACGEAHALVADVADQRAVYPLAGAAAALVGPIDILINNASTLGPTPLRLLLDSECEDFEDVLALNLLAPFRLTKAIAGSMALRGTGEIVNVSSDAAVSPYARWGAYSASKAALDQLSRVWAEELSGSGVRVLAVDPGEMDTDMHRAALPDANPATLLAPESVARCIVRMLEDPTLVSGTRVEASQWRQDHASSQSTTQDPA